ncbi:hypothetical protein [Bauldia sp.]|uniref:hypothetical protein n=1 Tax=Bauldia sp. TaxID=2575872 RepID=UPI003BABF035
MPKQSSDIFNPVGPAIPFSKSGQKWKIDKDVNVGSAGSAIFSAFTDSTLVNKGHVYSYNLYGAFFTKNNATLINKETGLINGPFGVVFDPDVLTDVKGSVENHGNIVGYLAGIYNSELGDFTVKNYGDIYGYEDGIYSNASNAGSTAGPVIKNFNSITSDEHGVSVGANDPSLRSKVVNQKDGVIEGGKIEEGGAAVYNPTGKIILINKGTIKGDVDVRNTENDTITNTGKINGTVILGAGNDKLDNRDGKVTGYIFGLEGKDKLIAGDAKEKFVFLGVLDGTTNVDRVKKFESGKDKFLLDKGSFPDLDTGPLAKAAFRKDIAAQDADDRIVYDETTGGLYYDDDGFGGDPQVLFARLDAGQKLKYSDFRVEFFE